MRPQSTRNLLGNRFRSNPTYRVTAFKELPENIRHTLNDLTKAPDFFGVLQPLRRPSLGLKAISRNVARLCEELKEPDCLPAFAIDAFGTDLNTQVARLVLDGVLELQTERGFVSGPRAHTSVFRRSASPSSRGLVSRISNDALIYAQALRITETRTLSARLYFFNRQPVTPRWRKALMDRKAVLEYLGLEKGGRLRCRMEGRWTEVPEKQDDPRYEGWVMWQARRTSKRPGRAGTANFKLYLSPRLEDLPAAIEPAVDLLTKHRAYSFKFGRDCYSLLRPDKMVAYFERQRDLKRCSRALGKALGRLTPQGVPFTCETAGGGLLSWGIDPPSEEHLVTWMERESWRLWVTNRLAQALLLARAEGDPECEPSRFAIDRIRLDGVDPETWMPDERLWQGSTCPSG